MRNKIFSFLLLVLLLIGVSMLIKPQNEESKLEKRGLATVNGLSFSQVLDGTFLSETDTVLKDQFYFRDHLLQEYYKFKIFLNKVILGSDSKSGIQYLNDNVIELNGEYLINNILTYDEELMNAAASKGYNLNEIDIMFPDVKTYVYMPTRIEEILDIPSNNLENYGSEYRNQYLINLNENITVSYLELDSVTQHTEYYYKSDFHWNHKGAYRGYSDIINMIRNDYDIDKPRNIKEEINYPYEFHGNVSSEIGMLGSPDTISDYILEGIGEYKRYVNGVEKYQTDIKNNYKINGNNSMYSDYDVYFGANDFERIYDFDQRDKPNVLVFCDSYFNVIQEWFSSHFNKTVIIDLRANEEFHIKDYVDKYDIDIILVCQMYKNLYFNGYTFIPTD